MNPYRRPGRTDDSSPRGDDERTILWITFLVGLLPVATALLRGGTWGAEPTIGLFLCALGALGLLASARDALRGRAPRTRRR